MCDNWRTKHFQHYKCEGTVLDSGDGEFIVRGHISSFENNRIIFWAPNPPTYVTSYTGSGLPYANPSMAYDNTPNKGSVMAKDGNFEFRIRYPNSYYMGLGTVCVQPCCHVKLCDDDKIHTIKLGNGIPFRMLTYPPSAPGTAARANPLFYGNRNELEIRTQEEILRASGFPEDNKTPVNFWGTRPAEP